ncbi:MAG TPA: hypothetical protein VEA59_02440 [Patescibacteria group bacterium]|nr:hypothetical protein [Patescibacteria group bacterium]
MPIKNKNQETHGSFNPRKLQGGAAAPASSPTTLYWVAGVVAVIILAAAAFWYFRVHSGPKVETANSTSSKQNQSEAVKEAENILDRVAKHIDLPQGEKPQVARVTDASKLKSKFPSLSNVKTGDYLVVYSTWTAVYDPEDDKLTTVTPLK